MSTKEIYTIRMARWLAKRGFTPVNVSTSTQNSSRLVYLFEDTPELAKAIKTYLMTDALKED